MTVRAMKAGASDFLLTAVTQALHRSRPLAPDTHPTAAVTPDAADDRRTEPFAEIVAHKCGAAPRPAASGTPGAD